MAIPLAWQSAQESICLWPVNWTWNFLFKMLTLFPREFVCCLPSLGVWPWGCYLAAVFKFGRGAKGPYWVQEGVSFQRLWQRLSTGKLEINNVTLHTQIHKQVKPMLSPLHMLIYLICMRFLPSSCLLTSISLIRKKQWDNPAPRRRHDYSQQQTESLDPSLLQSWHQTAKPH